MRLAAVAGRAHVVRGEDAFDIATASNGRFGPDPMTAFGKWSAVRTWADSAPLEDAIAFRPGLAQSPSPTPRQVFGIGLNYRAHQVESGFPEPAEPLIFTKFASSLAGPIGELTLLTDQVDWEAEVAVVIGQTAYQVETEDAWSNVADVSASQDFSARDVQMRPAGFPQFSLGKSFPGFTPLGPVRIAPDELENPDDIPLGCTVNGRIMRSSSTRDLIFPVPALISYLSSVLPLQPGDIILTGTPSGVGPGMTPPSYLQPGDEI